MSSHPAVVPCGKAPRNAHRLFTPQAIKRCVEKKSAEVFTTMSAELSLVKKGFDKQKGTPPLIHRDHPRYAGAALWARR